MCAADVGVVMMMTCWRTASRSKVRLTRPDDLMIAAHSAFLSMSPIEAFWTLRILPRIGSSAW